MSPVLYDLADFQNGRAFKSTETRELGGLPVIKIAEMNRGITSNTGRYSGEYDARHLIEPGALLFAWSGTIVIQRWAGPEALLNQHIFRVSAKPGVDQDFLRYLLLSFQATFEAIVADQRTTMGHVKVADLKQLSVDIPDLDVQRGIAATLACLDDKIDSNRRRIGATERLIRALIAVAVDEASVEVPISQLGTFVNGGAYTKGASGTGRMVIRIAELNSGPGDSTVYSDIDVPEDKTARAGDILMAWSGSLGVYRWHLDEAIVNQHIFKVVPKHDYPAWLVFDRLGVVMPVFQGIAKDKATTMGHIQRGHLDSTFVAVPDHHEISQLDSVISPLWRRLLALERESVRLAELRDVLLPALMTFRIRVPEATDTLAEVVA